MNSLTNLFGKPVPTNGPPLSIVPGYPQGQNNPEGPYGGMYAVRRHPMMRHPMMGLWALANRNQQAPLETTMQSTQTYTTPEQQPGNLAPSQSLPMVPPNAPSLADVLPSLQNDVVINGRRPTANTQPTYGNKMVMY